MSAVFPILLGIALLMTLGVLFAGIINMGRPGEASRERSNKLMRWRVILQGVAIVIFILALMAR